MNQDSFHTRLVKSWQRMISGWVSRVSKTFDRVIYSTHTSVVVAGILALIICVAINYQELSFQFFKGNAVSYTMPAVPVEMLGDESNYEITGVPSAVEVTVVGDAADIQLVRTQNSVTVTADLRNAPEGSSTIPLEPAGLPTGLDVSVYPSSADVTLTKKIAKTFFIYPDVIIGAGQNLASWQTPQLSATSVIVKATREKINAVRTVRAIVDTSGRDSDFTAQVPLVAYDATGKQVNVELSPSEVTATVLLKRSAAAADDSETKAEQD